MATTRDNPYGSFNFLVDFSNGDSASVLAGFQEVSGMNIEVTSADYRNGNSKVNRPVKVNGVYKVGDVTFKRGVMGSLDLYQWVDDVRKGAKVQRSVTISLQDEAHEGPVMTWKLTNARPIRYTAPSLNAKTGTDVAIEELVLSIEDIEIE
ncbi:phage tail protein [Nocardioides sp.]|uniref:phage tail protein n=1 Tax=Nocardioides sp. TaxID=35761 RepID=UPI002C11EC3D|nr:phage tail protein [Nocardioides sp.]HXH78137.1 phage tail protein [Nocardioides sp.]